MKSYEELSKECRIQIDVHLAYLKSTLYPDMGEREEGLLRENLAALVKDCLSIEAQDLRAGER